VNSHRQRITPQWISGHVVFLDARASWALVGATPPQVLLGEDEPVFRCGEAEYLTVEALSPVACAALTGW